MSFFSRSRSSLRGTFLFVPFPSRQRCHFHIIYAVELCNSEASLGCSCSDISEKMHILLATVGWRWQVKLFCDWIIFSCYICHHIKGTLRKKKLQEKPCDLGIFPISIFSYCCKCPPLLWWIFSPACYVIQSLIGFMLCDSTIFYYYQK